MPLVPQYSLAVDRRFVPLGAPVLLATTFPLSDEPLVRLFRKGRAELQAHPAGGGRAALHESWNCGGTVGTLAGTLLHFSYPDYAAYRAKYDRYTSLEAQGLRASRFGFVRPLAEGALVRLPWLLFGKGAALDGPRGIYVAYKSALYPAAVAWKARKA